MYILILTLVLGGTTGKAVSTEHISIPGGKQLCEVAAQEWQKSTAKNLPMSDHSAVCIKAK